jgi:serine/threonine protein kinase
VKIERGGRDELIESVFMGGGNMKYLKDHEEVVRGLPELEVQNIIKQVVEGLMELKKHGVSHGDLKPENIMITKYDESEDRALQSQTYDSNFNKDELINDDDDEDKGSPVKNNKSNVKFNLDLYGKNDIKTEQNLVEINKNNGILK